MRVFSREGNASRATATLEALAMLLAVRGKVGEDSSLDRPVLTQISWEWRTLEQAHHQGVPALSTLDVV